VLERFPTLRALGFADYRRIWLAFLISQTGQWMQITARAVLVFDITGSASALGLIYLASYSPQLLFALVGGVLADRFDRRHLVIVSATGQAALAVLLGVLAATGTATLTNLMVISFVVGVLQATMGPAQMALLPSLVPKEELHSAVSLQSTAVSVTRILGPLAAGAIIPIWGVDIAFYVNAITFLGPIQAWYRTEITHASDEATRQPVRAAIDGIRYVRRTSTLAVPLVMMAFISAVGLVYQPLGVVYATDVLAGGAKDLGSSYYGIIQAAIGLGSIVGVLSLAGLGRRRPAGVAFGTALAFGCALAALGASGHVVFAVAISFMIGVTHFANATLLQTLVQHASSDAMRGRVMAIFLLAFVGLFPFTSLVFGWLADLTSVRATFGIAGAAIVIFSLALLRWREHFRIDGDSQEEPVAEMPATAPAASPATP